MNAGTATWAASTKDAMSRLALAACACLALDASGQHPPEHSSDAAETSGETTMFKDRDFGGADLRGMDLRGVSFVSAALSFVRLDETDFSSADLRYATVTPVSARNAVFTQANMAYVTGNSGTFDGAFFGASQAPGSNFVGASFVGAVLTDMILTDASFAFADLTDADLTGAVVSGATFFGAVFRNTRCPDGTNSNNTPRCGL
jgi:uncharacterized protein YjbI with pentapeptide repeats